MNLILAGRHLTVPRDEYWNRFRVLKNVSEIPAGTPRATGFSPRNHGRDLLIIVLLGADDLTSPASGRR